MRQRDWKKAGMLLLFGMAVILLCWNRFCADRTYSLLSGTELETTVTVRKGKDEGASVYVLAGIHGDEVAGWKAAERLKRLRPSAGTVYVLSPANRYGAEQGQRLTKERRDLNRNFPGDPEGCDAERLAAAMYADIKEKRPDLVLDLHEAVPEKGTRDALGNSLICQSMEGCADLVLELLLASETGAFGDEAFTLYGSPPVGSVNRIVTEKLGIPVLTIETDRSEELTQRIEKQVKVVRFIFTYLNLLSETSGKISLE